MGYKVIFWPRYRLHNLALFLRLCLLCKIESSERKREREKEREKAKDRINVSSCNRSFVLISCPADLFNDLSATPHSEPLTQNPSLRAPHSATPTQQPHSAAPCSLLCIFLYDSHLKQISQEILQLI